MLTEPVLIDTGPLVAYFNKRDQHNAKCAAVFDEIAPPLYTCWPVLTEASYLLTTQGGLHLVEKLLDSCGTGFLDILPLSAYDAHAIADFLNRYGDQRPDVADAALMHLAEVRRYLTESGQDVFGEWLAGLKDARARAKVAARVARLAADSFGDCKPLREGVWELRVD